MRTAKYLSTAIPSLENIEDDEEYEVVSDRFDELLDEAEFEDLDD